MALTSGFVAALGVVFAATILVESLVDRTISVQPLSVPASLSEDGLTPEVAALNLRDEMTSLAERVRHERGFNGDAEIIDPEELPDVAVPSVGLSAQALAAEIRAFFKIQNRLVISGEIVARDGAYALTLRLNGRSVFVSPKRLPRDAVNQILAEGARAAVRATQPYAGAVLALDDGDDEAALALCDSIIGRGSGSREARFAGLLKGQALLAAGRHAEAAEAYGALIALDPRDVAAHVDLGDVLAALRRPEAAAAEYRKAIAVDPTLAFPHWHLAKADLALGRTEDALAEARAGADLSPTVLYPHLLLGRMLRGADRAAEAEQAYRAAARLPTKRAAVRVEIGEALLRFGLHDEAVGQFEAARALDPGAADARRGLDAALGPAGEDAASPSGSAPAPTAPTGPAPPVGSPKRLE